MEYSLGNYTGYGQYIAFRASNGNGGNNLRLDDVTLNYIPVCLHPVDLVVDGTTSETADIHWTEVGTASSWMVEYGPAGFRHGSGTTVSNITTTTLQLRDLTDTAYEFYLRARCATNLYSDWTKPLLLTYPPMLGIEGTELRQGAVKVTPNPVLRGGTISVAVDGADTPASIGLYDIQGHKLRTALLQPTGNTVELSTAGIKNAGLYLLRIATEAGTTLHKITVL